VPTTPGQLGAADAKELQLVRTHWYALIELGVRLHIDKSVEKASALFSRNGPMSSGQSGFISAMPVEARPDGAPGLEKVSSTTM
jgi:hypothetical protein